MSVNVTVSREIKASPQQVWDLISDLTRMGEWSPENEGGTWLKGAEGAAVGAKFRGANRNGKRRWKTVATVINADPAERLTFRTAVLGLPDAEWSYVLEPTELGCRVTESFTDQRPGWLKPVSAVVSGVKDRESHNRSGMQQTLVRLAQAAEAA